MAIYSLRGAAPTPVTAIQHRAKAAPLKVLNVIPSVAESDGGPSKALAGMEQALSAAGLEIVTATTDHAGAGLRLSAAAAPSEANGASRHYARKLLDFYKIAPGMVPWLWRNAPLFDIIHVHALFSFTSVVAGMIARMRRVPYVVRPLGTLTTYGIAKRRPWLKQISLRFIEGPLLQFSAAVHFTSQKELDEASCLGLSFRGVVIPLGVDSDPPEDDSPLVHDFPILKGRRTILYLSRLDPKKNVEALLRAVSLLQRERSDLILLIAGDGPVNYVLELKALAASLDIKRNVIWLGHVEGRRKAAAFAAADVFVLPSFSENFGVAAVEAMLAGLPVVLGDGVAIAGEVQEAGAGVSVEPKASHIARAIDRLLADYALRQAMGRRARAFAAGQYSTATMARRLISLYRDVAAGRFATQ